MRQCHWTQELSVAFPRLCHVDRLSKVAWKWGRLKNILCEEKLPDEELLSLENYYQFNLVANSTPFSIDSFIHLPTVLPLLIYYVTRTPQHCNYFIETLCIIQLFGITSKLLVYFNLKWRPLPAYNSNFLGLGGVVARNWLERVGTSLGLYIYNSTSGR
jgi:hypothetical protein